MEPFPRGMTSYIHEVQIVALRGSGCRGRPANKLFIHIPVTKAREMAPVLQQLVFYVYHISRVTRKLPSVVGSSVPSHRVFMADGNGGIAHSLMFCLL